MPDAYSLPGVKRYTPSFLRQSSAPVYQGPTKPETDKTTFRYSGRSSGGGSSTPAPAQEQMQASSAPSATPTALPGVPKGVNPFIAKQTNTTTISNMQKPILNPQTIRFIQGYKQALSKARNETEKFSNFVLNKVAPYTSEESSLKATQELQSKYQEYQNLAQKYNAETEKYNVKYSDRELSEEEVNTAALEQARLENKFQKVQQAEFELKKFEEKRKTKALREAGLSIQTSERKDYLKQVLGLDILGNAIYSVSRVPQGLLSIGQPKPKQTRKEMIESNIEAIPLQLATFGLSKGFKSTKTYLTKIDKLELVAPAKVSTGSITRIKKEEVAAGTLTKVNIDLASYQTPKIVKATSKIDRVLQKVEDARAKLLNIKPKSYGEIIEGKPSAAGSKSYDIYYLRDKRIGDANFLTKGYRTTTKFEKIKGGMTGEVKAGLLDKKIKTIKKDLEIETNIKKIENDNIKNNRELGEALAEGYTGTPNIKAFGKERMVNLGYQKSKEIAKLLNKRKVTMDFDGLLVSQNRPLVKPTPSGRTINRANIAGITDEININNPNLKLYKEVFVAKDVTYPFKKTKPFKIQGLIIEELGDINKVFKSGGGQAKQTPSVSLSQEQVNKILTDLQGVKGSMAIKNIKSLTKPKTNKQILNEINKINTLPSSPVSLYYGKGIYERTEAITFNEPKIFNRPTLDITITNFNPNNIRFDTLSNTKLNQDNLLLTETNQIEKTFTRSNIKLDQPTRLIEETKQVQRQQPKLFTDLNYIRALKEIQKTKITIPRISKFKFTPFLFGMNNKMIGKQIDKLEPGYKVFTKRKGKVFEVPGLFGRGEALQRLESKLLSSLAARGGIRKTTSLIQTRAKSYKINTNLFRPYKIKNRRPIALVDEYIQRRSKRLSTPLEIAEIQRSRRR